MPSVVRIHLRPLPAEVAQLIEHQPSKLRVASLSLVFRSKKKGVSFRCSFFAFMGVSSSTLKLFSATAPLFRYFFEEIYYGGVVVGVAIKEFHT